MTIDNNPNVEEAGKLAAEVGDVIADRNGTHGDPVENHNHIAKLWSVFLESILSRPITGDEVADMMILLKLSRKQVGGMDLDHYRDSIGYAAIASLYVPADNEPSEQTDCGTNPAYEEAYQNLVSGTD